MSSLNGVLPLYKPVGPTSHDMIDRVRKHLKKTKVGHSGTLDPFADGVLVLGIGKGTRILEFLKDRSKEYIMTMRFGLLTDTYDIEGEVVRDEQARIERADLEDVLEQFRGEIEQVPPVYSARKYKGRRLYELAREGKIIRMPPRKVMIHNLEILGFDDSEKKQPELRIKATVSAGTYLRSLAVDIGFQLNTCATAVQLTRTKNAGFEYHPDSGGGDCLVLGESEKTPPFADYLVSMNDALGFLDEISVTEEAKRLISNGNPVTVSMIKHRSDFKKGDIIRIKDETNQLLGLGKAERDSAFCDTLINHDRDERIVKPRKVFQ